MITKPKRQVVQSNTITNSSSSILLLFSTAHKLKEIHTTRSMIKLFGMTIHSSPNKEEDNQLTCNTKAPTPRNHGESTGMEQVVEQAKKEEPGTPNGPERGGTTTLSEIIQDPETSSVDTSSCDEKSLEKPDKLLPCPRCSSMDTKFCYYNNYNVSQPRHFCKKCQRYWTAGGTMRSVPVGSGRRKNKCSPASRYRQIIVTEALEAANGIYQPNGTLLAFGSDSAQCENMSSALIHTAKSENRVRNNSFEETGDDNSSGSSSTVLNPKEKVICVKPTLKNIQESPAQFPCFPVPPWASPWNTAERRSATQQPAFCPPGFPSSFYPTPPYWGCTAPNPWNLPWFSPQCSHSVRSPGCNCQILGKHSRDGSNIGSSNPEKLHLEDGDLRRGVLRIHHPIEAAQTSHTKKVNESGLREASGTKGVERYHMTKAAMVLQANPAALHRSYNFLETA